VRAALLALTLAASLAASLAAAQKPPAARHNADQPIEINADRLEVEQNNQLATFSGNVDARQGDIRLRASQLKVWYRSGGGARSAAADVGGSIVRIDALGDVLVTSPQESARGDVGVYDVANREITLTGEVVLTRGENVIRGQKLVMDMDTGVSRMQGGAGGGRVRGLFTPPRKETQ
jgi:lipopolysaccharide export system protein LptA